MADTKKVDVKKMAEEAKKATETVKVAAGKAASSVKATAEKAKKQGVKVRLSIYEGMFHVFQMAMLMMPESKRAWAEVGKFIEMISE